MNKIYTMALAGLALTMMACGGSKNDTATASADAAEAYETNINIRYVVRDSITSNYIFAETVSQANQQIELEYMTYANQLQTQLQNMQQEFNQKINNNVYLTEQSARADYNRIQTQAANYERLSQQRQADAAVRIQANLQALQDSINNFMIVYNREHQYDAILFKEDCLYLNPALDITAEVVEGLNQRYNPAAAAPAAATPAAAAPAAAAPATAAPAATAPAAAAPAAAAPATAQ